MGGEKPDRGDGRGNERYNPQEAGALGIRVEYEQVSKFVDDPEKRAAWEVLYGSQDWDNIARYRIDRDEEWARRNAGRQGGRGEGGDAAPA